MLHFETLPTGTLDLLKNLTAMRWLIIIFFGLLNGCTLICPGDQQFSTMRECYKYTTSFENDDSLDRADEFVHLRFQSNQQYCRDFWKAYSNYNQACGSFRAKRALKRLVTELGTSTALIVPINKDLRGPELDSMIDQMLQDDQKPTTLLSRVVGQPCDLKRVEQYRINASRL
ncbi:MAG TPA: hypothetical protein PLB55_05495 [Prosthecobacter sp.]|nr:hypothetical protein [Prosthecobacter sp.]